MFQKYSNVFCTKPFCFLPVLNLSLLSAPSRVLYCFPVKKAPKRSLNGNDGSGGLQEQDNTRTTQLVQEKEALAKKIVDLEMLNSQASRSNVL